MGEKGAKKGDNAAEEKATHVDHVCRGGETSSARCQLGKKARGNRERTPEPNVDICSWELCGGLIAWEGFLEEVVIERKLNGREGASHVKIWGKGISGRGKEQSAKALRCE